MIRACIRSLPLTALALMSFVLSGCAGLENPFLAKQSPDPAETVRAETARNAPVPVSTAKTAEAFDTTSEAERKIAAEKPVVGSFIGRTVISLGAPAEPGFWLKTPLVESQTEGQVIDPASGKSVAVTLIPIEGPSTAGSRLSLAAMRLLGVPLTALVDVEVRRAG
jgi:hypothetical protein